MKKISVYVLLFALGCITGQLIPQWLPAFSSLALSVQGDDLYYHTKNLAKAISRYNLTYPETKITGTEPVDVIFERLAVHDLAEHTRRYLREQSVDVVIVASWVICAKGERCVRMGFVP